MAEKILEDKKPEGKSPEESNPKGNDLEVKFYIDKNKIVGYTDSAKNRISSIAEEYVLEIISEAERIDLATRHGGACIDITDNTILEAARICRIKGYYKKKSKVLSLISDALLFATGLFFSLDNFVNNGSLDIGYTVFILVLIIASVITKCIVHFRED